jgi:hypothetical protein
LTDNVTLPRKWVFPPVSIGADGYLVVFASSKNRVNPSSALHTNFSLSAGGEYLGLYDIDGITPLSEYSPVYPAQAADVSYGIDSNNKILFFSNPSPGKANGVGDVPIAQGVTTNVNRGFYTASFSVTLATTQPNAQIRYTLDGSAPTTTSTAFVSPIAVTTTTVLRAAAFASGFLPSPTATFSYIFPAHVIQQPETIVGFPNGRMRPTGAAGSVPLDMAMDPAVVTAYSSEIISSMTAIKTLSLTASLSDMFGSAGFYFGTDIERPSSIEILDAVNPIANEQINVGVESHSWDRLKRSLRLNFRSAYGKKEWKTSFLKNNAPLNGASCTTTLSRIILRGGNNRCVSTSVAVLAISKQCYIDLPNRLCLYRTSVGQELESRRNVIHRRPVLSGLPDRDERLRLPWNVRSPLPEWRVLGCLQPRRTP